ncbi:MAG TPA: antibiotic biosynthesis monooxygenase [Acidimicrobiales bacterium]|jgi:quinol monooxygenase YgiN|nr:antibiotic biosynthesis monooxygenase [Acidimicrobiales bacterium]
MAKIAIVATLTAKPGRFDDLVALVRWMVGEAAAEPGTEVYAANVTDAAEGAVWIYEVYTDEDALATHSTSSAMRQFVDALHDIAEPEMVGRRLSLAASTGLPS